MKTPSIEAQCLGDRPQALREAMAKKGTIAIGRLVMSTRERICALEPGRDEIVLTTLRTHEEVRDVRRSARSICRKPIHALGEAFRSQLGANGRAQSPSL
jgi:hypothetical protein